MNHAYAAVTIDKNTYAPALFDSLGSLVSVLLPNIYILAGILLFFLLIGGGLAVIAGGQESDPRKTGQGASAVTSALIGFLIIFTSYWIIQIVEAITGFKIL
ncbi:hypothetical protein COT44_03490 [Candidatus Shapirobacteria bacterium CG08_land_8_20_14_0_20_39_18]|uniref:Uncharacterized protein n=1 Tax=Candidatus Shapirobacteria bacterium CG08_land_8_20_14_0_20_39_18 TaxID=1974883 RepID=A0A2M6XCT7_9BACT|nr:MAG: hypothetical protein COT44_03490 [Candidatus Shapirobacteria bacterium CG08_land_8_20_14_0_20_39_18]PIY65124.1 MAG: hypothetical protein COY91_03600 [Candidatus Shapirobacteria bacterium CG_4_10_14_0_8_um_filter_39_15]